MTSKSVRSSSTIVAAPSENPPQKRKRGPKLKPVVEFPDAIVEDWIDVPVFHEALSMHAARHGDSICHLHKALTHYGDRIERSTLLQWAAGLEDAAWAKANAAGSYGLHYNAVVDDAWGSVALGMFSFMGSGVRIVDLRDPTHPREVAYYHPGATDAPSPLGPLAGKTDSCVSINSFVPETGHIRFTCRSGFYIAELSQKVRTYFSINMQ